MPVLECIQALSLGEVRLQCSMQRVRPPMFRYTPRKIYSIVTTQVFVVSVLYESRGERLRV